MEERSPKEWFAEAARVAQDATCLRAQCGAVIVQGGVIIGAGSNGPAGGILEERRCHVDTYDRSKKPKYDLTCCVHAEWRAILDAMRSHADALPGSTLYYVRLGTDGVRRYSGAPFCTVCSRLALEVGISSFGLWHESGAVLYDTRDYNARSYAFHLKEGVEGAED